MRARGFATVADIFGGYGAVCPTSSGTDAERRPHRWGHRLCGDEVTAMGAPTSPSIDPLDHLPTVDVTEAARRPSGVVLVDVREDSEWAEGHAPGAHHQPLGQLDPAHLPEADTVFVICRSGNRSARATRVLVRAGLDARNVEGGMSAWSDAGLPVVTE